VTLQLSFLFCKTN